MTDMQTPEPEKKPIWTRWWMIVIYVFVGLGIIGSLGGDDTDGDPLAGEALTTTEASDTTEPEETTTTSEATTTTTTTTTEVTTTLPTAFLGMTVAEAPDRWNQAADLLGSDRRITGTMPERDLANGGKAHQWDFTDTATLEVVAFGENVQAVTLLTGVSSDEDEAALDVLVDIATWIVMVDPNLVETSRGEILTGLLENLDQGVLDNEVVRNGVRYSASNVASLLVFTAEPA